MRMDIRKHLRLALPLVLSGIVAFMAFQFFFGNLGVVDAWAKQRTIAGIRQDIASIKAASAQRQRQIDLLTTDKGTIRSLALLYGMTGGEQIQPKTLPPRTVPAHPTQSVSSRDEQPFLIRHPVLLIIPGAILALLTGFFVAQRQRARQHAAVTNRSRCIKPTWTA